MDRYGFLKDAKRDVWIKQPSFQGVLGNNEFIAAAERVQQFFYRNNNWETTKKNPKFRTKVSCINLLYITAARYLLVTHILYLESDKKLIPCSRTNDKKIAIPDSGVCFPEPYGSASCTSDYDVGLIGKDAGYLTEKFNRYFQDVAEFRKPSEMVFDTNVYAFTLEFSMPFLFSGLPKNFVKGVELNEETANFKMQELASAYYKVFKYNEVFFKTLETSAKKAMTAENFKNKLTIWLNAFDKLNDIVPMRVNGNLNTLEALRTSHNNEYQRYVKEISTAGGYYPNFLGNHRLKRLHYYLHVKCTFCHRTPAKLSHGLPIHFLIQHYLYAVFLFSVLCKDDFPNVFSIFLFDP